MSNILGVSCGFHDAGVAVVSDTGEILFASHSERYSKQKHDANLCPAILTAAQEYGKIGTVAYYENHWLKKWRQFRAGQRVDRTLTLRSTLESQFGKHFDLLDNLRCGLKSFSHHKSHAAAGFQTSPYDDATVVVIDAIGEMDTVSIWHAEYDRKGRAKYKKLWGMKYPQSIGLFYSAFTKRAGLRPLDEEYILMGMAAYGKPNYEEHILSKYVQALNPPTFKENLHTGCEEFMPNVDFKDSNQQGYDLAASAQNIVEQFIYNIMAKARQVGKSKNLVYMGGVALNCSANRNLGRYYGNIWIMPNPGDAGSALGAAALAYGKKLHWKDAFLGEEIAGEYPVKPLLDELLTNKIVGVASGRAEYGPRALGTRSLLADPRGPEIKDQVNEIKRRQKFRPFAPVILEEYANDYFKMPHGFNTSPYMQVTAPCKRPDDFPAIVHADGTSRVQTVPNDGSGIRRLLEAWYELTGCPMLLNTSLNIRGEPMVNDRADADRFEKLYNVKVCS